MIGRGFRPVALARVLNRSIALHCMVYDESEYGMLTDRSGRTTFLLGEGYIRSAGTTSEMRETMRNLRPLLDELRGMLPEEERSYQSSLDLAPGIVRTTGRRELAERPARILPEQKD